MQQYLIIALAIVGYAASAAVDTVVEIQTSTTETAVNRALLSVNEDCHQPKETGRCFALFHRYAFNVESFACEEFIYGGCAGNKNNFETKEECESFCLPAPNAESSTEVSVTESKAAPIGSTDVSVDASSTTESANTSTESSDVSVDASSSTASTSTESAKVAAVV